MSSSAWFVGDGTLLIQAAETWLELGHSVSGIASREPAVVHWGKERGLSVVPPGELVDAAQKAPFDYLFSVVNLSILKESALALPRKLAVNFHDGFLPFYAGVNVPVWAMLNGESSHGVTWHVMTKGADEGDVLVQRAFDIAPDETAFSLNAKCFTNGMETFRELAEQITKGELSPVAQSFAERKYFDFYARPADALLAHFDVPADELARRVRALDFGTYANPMGSVRVVLASGRALSIGAASVLDSESGQQPGKVLSVDDDGVVVATSTADVKLSRLRLGTGTVLDKAGLAALGVVEGTSFPKFDTATRARFAEAVTEAARSEGYFVRRLAALSPLELELGAGGADGRRTVSLAIPPAIDRTRLPGLCLAFAARKSGMATFDLSYADAKLRDKTAFAPALFATEVPLRVELDLEASLDSAIERADAARAALDSRHAPTSDLALRRPELAGAELSVALLVDVPLTPESADYALCFLVDTTRDSIELSARSDLHDAGALDRLAHRFELFLANSLGSSSKLKRIPLLAAEEETLLERWNATARDVPAGVCVHQLFQAQVEKTPDRPAVTAREETLTFRELDRRANAVAKALVESGVGPDTLVGLYLERSVHMVVALLGILKAGGAYLPLDPSYPEERVRFMLEDARLSVVVCDRASEGSLPSTAVKRIVVDGGGFDSGQDAAPATAVNEQNLAYVIYTSGSTGKPKGVMVEHRNVVNFLCGMDDVLSPNGTGSWLAVTSLSFDISVLELIWSLTRGLSVVVYPGDAHVAASTSRHIDFSVFYFASATFTGPESYRLLFEGARFADENGFCAVWTPERHFHAFGGLYPNPSLTNAALAMVTKHVQLRAGSCVSPLHSPLRIAEEWAFVDNLSHGRVGISFASGWQPNDFVLKPDAFQRRKEQMVEDVETVRRLWRGESVTLTNGLGKEASVKTLPRPVQKELPIWLTAAGSPETFEEAGRLGANILTHLLGQSLDDVAKKVERYREARRKAGHAGRGTVTLMLHSFIGADDALVKETVRGPMKEYLRSAVGLIKEAAWTFPTFRQSVDDGSFSPNQLTKEELDAVLDHAFERYYGTSALFGTVDGAVEFVMRCQAIDTDEIACLIDFGVDAQSKVTAALSALTAREREVLNLVVKGLPNKLIAKQLGISHRTVEQHRSHIFDKLGVTSVAELIYALPGRSA